MQSNIVKITQSTSEIIKSTIPLLKENGESVVERMYDYLLVNYPEFESYFNNAHLGDGDRKQIKIVKEFLVFYAENFDTPTVLIPVLEEVTQRHAAKRILPEYYPPVGESVLHAIQEEFNLPDDHEILEAWAKGYHFLADIMIQLEKDIYAVNKAKKKSWTGYKELSVLEAIEETSDVVRLWLSSADNDPLVDASPMQYVTLYVPELKQSREYSLVASKPNFYEIAVKRDGQVSQYLHENAKPGTKILVSMPFGGCDKTIAELKDNVFIFSGGIGVTAHLELLSEFRYSLSSKQAFHFHSVKNRSSHCFFNDLAILAESVNIHNINVYSNPSETDKCGEHYLLDGRLNIRILAELAVSPNKMSCFVCGSPDYMAGIKALLTEYGVDRRDIHFEHFGPTEKLS